MRVRPLALALALALAIATATCTPNRPALAEATQGAVCGPYQEIQETLRQRFGETLRFRADESRGFALELFAREGGTWTLVMRQDERACAIAAGETWRERPESGDAF